MRGKIGYYYPQTTKRMLITVLNIMSGVIVYKYDKNGQIVDEVGVEILSGPAQTKHRGRTNESQQEYYPKFPRIEVHYEGMTLDETRLMSPETKRYWNSENVKVNIKDHNNVDLLDINGLFADFSPIPYNYVFSVNVFAEYIDHISQIIENIFPYFTPANTTLRVKEFDFLNIERDIKITLGNPAIQFDTQDIVAGDRRQVSCNFSLTLDGYMYRKIESSKILNSSVAKFYSDSLNNTAGDVDFNNIAISKPYLRQTNIPLDAEFTVEYNTTIVPNDGTDDSLVINVGTTDELGSNSIIETYHIGDSNITLYNIEGLLTPSTFNAIKIKPTDNLPENSKIWVTISNGFFRTTEDKPISGVYESIDWYFFTGV